MAGSPRLPIDAHLPDLHRLLQTNRRCVILAPTGSGKTTRVAPSLWRDGLVDSTHPAIVLTQPRRVATRSVARRISQEQGCQLGKEVGYHIRGERRWGRSTRLRVVTEGILLRHLLADPFLEGIGTVVLDEFHERNLDLDLILAMLRETISAGRDDLIVIVMSATLDPQPLQEFLDPCPRLEVEGRAYPVEIQYQPPASDDEPFTDQVVRGLTTWFPRTSGDALIFLPGFSEIRQCRFALSRLAPSWDADVLILHGSLNPQEQDQVFETHQRRRIILSTNIAETSLTIDGVTLVIDSGWVREASFDYASGLDRLDLVSISRASANQRAGRAGRTAPGICVRLWDPIRDSERREQTLPEVHRLDLASAALTVHAWGCQDISTFDWFESPQPRHLDHAENLLIRLGAWDRQKRRLTALGQAISQLPVHPRLAKLLILGSRLGLGEDAATLVAILTERDFLRPGTSDLSKDRSVSCSDLLDRLELVQEAARSGFRSCDDPRVDLDAIRQVDRARRELLRFLGTGSGQEADQLVEECERFRPDLDQRETTLLKLILIAFPDRVVQHREQDPTRGRMVGGRGIYISRESQVRAERFSVAIQCRETDPRSRMGQNSPNEAIIQLASAIQTEWLERLIPEGCRSTRDTTYDDQSDRVVTIETDWYEDLLLRQRRSHQVDPSEAQRILAEVLKRDLTSWLASDVEAWRFFQRLKLARTALPSENWPELDQSQLAELAFIASSGCLSRREVEKKSILSLILGLVSYVQARQLDLDFPSHVTVPSGRRVALLYHDDQTLAPTLSAKVQELFGLAETPTIARGRIKLRLDLLGPNNRSVQVTDDLASFWSQTYAQVRKDLRGRYPKHDWPENPETAVASRGPKRRPPT